MTAPSVNCDPANVKIDMIFRAVLQLSTLSITVGRDAHIAPHYL